MSATGTNITLIQNYNGQRCITFTLGTSYYNEGQNIVMFNCTGVDEEGNNYTAVGYYDSCYMFIINNLTQV